VRGGVGGRGVTRELERVCSREREDKPGGTLDIEAEDEEEKESEFNIKSLMP